MGGKSGGGYRAPVEAPNSLQSMQEVTIVEAVSEGPIVGLATGDAKSIALNETPLMTDEGAYTYQNVSWAIRLGTADQDAFSDVSGVETETSVGVEVTKYFPRASGSGSGAVTRQITNPYCTAVRITMSVGALYEQLVDQDRAGDTVAMTVSYNVRITDNNNSVVVSDDVERTDKTTSGAQWAKKYTLTGSAPWTVTVTKTYDDNTSDYKHNDIYWAAYTEIIGYKMIYPHTACMMVRGNAETFGSSVPNRAYKIKGLIVEVPNNYDPETRQYSGIWDGTFKNAWTDNPAWVLRDIIESGRYGLKKFFPPAKQGNALCDKWTLYEIAKYCDEYVSDGEGGSEPRYRFNGQIMGSGSAREVLQSIASNFHGMMYWGSGMVMASSDVPKDPIKSLTQANVIDGAITYSTGSAQERHSVALVTWYDPDNYGNARIEPVYDWDAYQRYGYRPINVTAYGCTSRAQAHRQGLWTLLTEDEQWQASCVVGLDGYDLMPGDFVRIADPHWMGTRFSGRIESIDGTSVTLDGEVSFASGENYVLYVVMPDGTEEHRDITTGAGTHTTITIASAFSKAPVDHAVWTISGTDVAPRLFAVRSIEEQEAGKLKLSLREVMSSKYTRLEQSITFTTTPGRRPTAGVLAAPTGLTVVPANYISGGQVYQRLTFSWVGSGDSAVSEYEFGYRSPAGDWNSFAPKKTFSMDIAAAASGTYLFRVRALSLDGRQSSWAEKSYELAGVTTVPKAPTNLSAVGGYRSIQVRWQMPSDALIGYFEILMADSDSLEDAELAGKIYGSSFDVMDLGIMETKWFWVRSVSYADGGIYSEAVGPVSATTKALEMTEIPEASIDESKLLPGLAQKIDGIDEINAAIPPIVAKIDNIGTVTIPAILGRLENVGMAAIPALLNALSLDQTMEQGAGAERTLSTKVDEGLAAEATERLKLTARVNDTMAAVTEESTARAEGDDALSQRITTIGAQIAETAAVIEEETTARIEGDAALSQQIATVSAKADNNAAVIQEESTARADEDEALSQRITTLGAEIDGTQAAIQEEQNARADGDGALAEQITTLGAQTSESLAAIRQEMTADTSNGVAITLNALSQDKAMESQAIAERTLTVKYNEEVAERLLLAIKQGETQAALEAVNQIVSGPNGLVAQSYIKTDVNGHVAGVGLYNDGNASEFVVVANRFLIANADGSATPMFEINGTTGLAQLIGSLIASGSLTGRELNAAAQIQLGDGGQFIAGSGAIVQIGTEGNNAAMLFDSETGRIVIKDPNNLTTGDYISMAVGDISTYKYLSGSYRQMKSLRKMEVGIGINGQVVTLPGYWPSQPKIQVSPYALQCYDSNYPGQNQQLKCYADAIAYNDGVVTFVPRAYLEIAAGNSYVGSPVSVHAQTIGKTPAAEDASIPITVNSDTYSSVPNGSVNIAVQVKVYAQIISNFVIEGDIFSGYVTRYTYSPVKVTVTAHLGNASLVLGVHTFAAALKDLSSEPTSEYVTFSGTFSNGSGSVYISAYIEIAETSVITSTQFNGAPSRCWLRLDSITWGLQGSTQLASGTLNYVAIAE